MKVLVTGAGGFLGKQVVRAFLERGHSVRAMLRPASLSVPFEWNGKAEIVRGDLRAPTDAQKWFDGVDVLVHLAATVRGAPEAQFFGTVVSTEKLLAAMQKAGGSTGSPSGCKRIVFASSFSVYDWTAAKGKLTEETPVDSKPYERDGYAIAKIWQERVMRRLSEENGWKLAVMRPGFIYGPGGPEVSGAGMKVGRAYLVVAPTARLPLTHVENCAQAFVDAAEKNAEGVFNVVDDEVITSWKYSARLLGSSGALRVPFPYPLGLALAHTAESVSRFLFPPKGGKLPGILVPRRYRARFRPLRFENKRAKETLGWSSKPLFASGGAVL